MAARDDPQFAKDIFKGTAVNAIVAYQDHQFDLLEDALSSMPMDYRKTPFRQHIIDSTPMLVIRARVEKMLWHQRLGHPCDEYLYNAHKWVDGVPVCV